jgi:hypothetical protein
MPQSLYRPGNTIIISIKKIITEQPITSCFLGMNCLLSGWGKHGPSENIPSDIYGQPWNLRSHKSTIFTSLEHFRSFFPLIN